MVVGRVDLGHNLKDAAPLIKILSSGTKDSPSGNFTTVGVTWVSSEVAKHAPALFWRYDAKVLYDKRIERVMNFITGEAKDFKEKAVFVTAYFENVDRAGHKHEPDSPKVSAEIVKVD